jgi:predicted nucleic acid-binding protein
MWKGCETVRYLVDSFAWMEYFMGSERGEKVKKIVGDAATECLVSAINIAEIYSKSIRVDGIDRAEDRMSFILSRCAVVDVDDALAVEAAKIDALMKKRVKGWGLADSIVLATARAAGAKIVTWDKHFQGIAEVEPL